MKYHLKGTARPSVGAVDPGAAKPDGDSKEPGAKPSVGVVKPGPPSRSYAKSTYAS